MSPRVGWMFIAVAVCQGSLLIPDSGADGGGGVQGVLANDAHTMVVESGGSTAGCGWDGGVQALQKVEDDDVCELCPQPAVAVAFATRQPGWMGGASVVVSGWAGAVAVATRDPAAELWWWQLPVSCERPRGRLWGLVQHS